MISDSRGGSNRKSINKSFFKFWSPPMSYVLGLLFADGTMVDAQNSSRTRYFAFTSRDYCLIKKVRGVLQSNHCIYKRKPRYININGKSYLSREHYVLRIGSKEMFNDLLSLGLEPRKSLVMTLPLIPREYFPYFLRGYFDGDGCISVENQEGHKAKLSIVFISGSKEYLVDLKKQISGLLPIIGGCLCKGDGAFQLRFRKKDGLNLLHFMYHNIDSTPYLNRKYQVYKAFIKR